LSPLGPDGPGQKPEITLISGFFIAVSGNAKTDLFA
jgi:hypothetical protein